jgi:tetratricopeptide (TPR) repeat protein
MKFVLSSLLFAVCLCAQDPKSAFERGDYRAAIPLFESAHRTKPDCANLLYIGLSRYRLQQPAEALISFRAAIACNPKLLAAHLALGEAYEARGNDGEALTAYLQAVAVDANNLIGLRAAANLYLKSELHAKAQPLLEKLARLTPSAADVRADLGAVFATSGDRQKAEAEFRKALEIDPNYFPALSGLGNLLARAGDNEAALPLLRKAVGARPQAFEGHFLLGSALNRLNQFEEARKELELAAKLGGDGEPQVFYQLARACGGLGLAEERKAALAKFSELTKKEKDNTERQRQAARWIDEARVHLQSGNLEAAALRLEMARETRAGDASLLFRLAGLNFDLLRFDTAREYVQAAISISPATWLYHYLLGLVEKSANHLADARTSLELAAKLNSTEAVVFNALGEVVLEQGDRKLAVSYFEQAAKLAPNDPRFRENLEFARKN